MSRFSAFTVCCLLVLLPGACCAQVADGWFNTDSLLTRLSHSKKMKLTLQKASGIYNKAGVDTANISLPAFKLAYLEKWLIDSRQYPLKHNLYRKKNILTVVDYTRPSNARRFMTIDLQHSRILFDTLVAQGSGRGALRNDKYCLPVYFSNALNSDCSSPGMAVTTRGTHPDNPCHLCRYSLSRKHDCVVVLEGTEKGINDNLLARDVVIHTTGSYSFGADSLRRLLGIKDTLYRVVPESCECCTGSNGTVKSTSAYATACGMEENNGYIGQSNGCLVLPEDDHIDIMRTVKGGSLIFVYTNAITSGCNYFRDSPVVRRLVRMGR
jgi:hypothetical protein